MTYKVIGMPITPEKDNLASSACASWHVPVEDCEQQSPRIVTAAFFEDQRPLVIRSQPKPEATANMVESAADAMYCAGTVPRRTVVALRSASLSSGREQKLHENGLRVGRIVAIWGTGAVFIPDQDPPPRVTISPVVVTLQAHQGRCAARPCRTALDQPRCCFLSALQSVQVAAASAGPRPTGHRPEISQSAAVTRGPRGRWTPLSMFLRIPHLASADPSGTGPSCVGHTAAHMRQSQNPRAAVRPRANQIHRDRNGCRPSLSRRRASRPSEGFREVVAGTLRGRDPCARWSRTVSSDNAGAGRTSPGPR